jgi:hypothetical protein
MKAGDRVMFTPAVVRRCAHEPAVAAMRGRVHSIVLGGKVALVDTAGTYPNADGSPHRFIPTANLEVTP